MDNLYVVRWGPALGDDFSVQVFTGKWAMNAFIQEMMSDKAKVGWEELSFEVHYVDGSNIDVLPQLENEDGVYDDASDLIAFGDNKGGEVIWRNRTARHQI